MYESIKIKHKKGIFCKVKQYNKIDFLGDKEYLS